MGVTVRLAAVEDCKSLYSPPSPAADDAIPDCTVNEGRENAI